MDFLKINGAFGEGGGQIVRTAITLSCITNQPIILENVRKNRKIPGLRPQHVSAINILRKISDAKIEGVNIGSTSFKFAPSKIKSMKLVEDIGTAGSIGLILQALIPVCSICNSKLDLTVTGGTDVSWSPTANYSKYVLHEAYSRMGIKFSINVIKRGYYPKGGGKIQIQVLPSKIINPLFLKKRTSKNIKLVCSFSKIPVGEILPQIDNMKEELSRFGFNVKSEILEEPALNAGASIMIFSIENEAIIGVDALFNLKSKNFDEKIIEKFLGNDLGLDENLADMVVVPASLADGMTIFRVKNISKHLETNLYVTSKITGCKYGIGKIDDGFEIRIEGISYTSIH